jgi:hypothetical protein
MPTAKDMPTVDEQLRAFRSCPPLEVQECTRLLPNLMRVAMMVSATLMVCPEWGLFAILTIISALVPADRFRHCPALKVSSAMWVNLLHPGATNSSGVIALVARTVEKLMTRLHADEKREAEENTPADEATTYPPKRHLLAGGGSLAATGLQMSQGQNRSAALAVEPEVDGVLSWFRQEGSSCDKGAPGKLWDNVNWSRPVMDKTRAYDVIAPWFGFISAGHIPELFTSCAKDDFGLRQRLTKSFGVPAWCSVAELRAACEALPVRSKEPSDFLCALLYPVLRWALAQPNGTEYTADPEDGA